MRPAARCGAAARRPAAARDRPEGRGDQRLRANDRTRPRAIAARSREAREARSIETSRRMREHGVDLAVLGGEIGAGDDLAAVVARDLLEQPFEFLDIAVDRLLEFPVGTIFAADLVEGLLSLQRVEPPREHVALAALVAVPQVDRGLMVDHPRNVDRQRIERLDRVPDRAFVVARGLARKFMPRLVALARGAAEQVAEPASTAVGGRRLASAARRESGVRSRRRARVAAVAARGRLAAAGRKRKRRRLLAL